MKLSALSVAAVLTVSAPLSALAAVQDAPVAATLPNGFDQPASAPASAQAASASQTRAETALRAVVANLRTDNIDYAVFSDDLAAQIREQAPMVQSLLVQFGDLKAVRHASQQNGVELFRVDFENQATDWAIGFDENGKIAALLFRLAED